MLARLLRLLRDRNFLLVAALALGLLAGQRAHGLAPLSLPALGVAMTVSLTGVVARDLSSWRQVGRATVLSIVLTYGINGLLTLILARLLVPDPELWLGFVLLAATPSGIAVIPFSYVLGGDTVFALVGSLGAYLSAIVIMPVMAGVLAGSALVSPARLATILVQLVLIPLAVSRLINACPFKPAIERWRGTIVNWAFALVIFIVIALNRDSLLRQPGTVLVLGLIALATNFGLGAVLEWALGKLHLNRATRLTSVMMGTVKNTSLTAATALALFGERVSLPAAVVSVTNVLYLVWLGVHWAEEGKHLRFRP
jgi:BASS family bile acid:Na+ symporter